MVLLSAILFKSSIGIGIGNTFCQSISIGIDNSYSASALLAMQTAVIARVILSVRLSVLQSRSDVFFRRMKIRSCSFQRQVAKSF